MAAGLIAAVAPKFGLVGVGILVALLLAFYSVFTLPGWVFFLLISKPLIDLTWRWRFIEIAEQGVNIQTLVSVFVILLTGLALILRRRQVVLWRWIVLPGFCCDFCGSHPYFLGH